MNKKTFIGGLITSAALVAAFAAMQPVDAGYTHPTTTHRAYTTTTVVQTPTTTVVPSTVVATTTTTEVGTSTTTLPSTTSTVPPSTSTSTIPITSTSIPSESSTTVIPTTSSTTIPTPTSSTTTTVLPTTTSTSTSTSTTTTLPTTFEFGAVGTICIREVPFIRITFQNLFPSLAGQTGTLTMRNVNGIVVSTQSLVYQPGATVDVLYPGTAVNLDGSVADVPGWILNEDGFWVLDPSDAFLREGIFVTYEVNPTAGPVLVTYPPESSACANPNGPFPPPRLVPGELPPTE